jgi:hypothetical protein
VLYRILASSLVLAAVQPARAIDRIELDIARVTASAFTASDVRARLELPADAPEKVTLTAAQVNAAESIGRLTDVTVECTGPIVREPRFACPDARVRARGTPIGALAFRATADFASNTGVLAFGATGVAVGGGTARLDGRLDERGWRVETKLRDLRLTELRTLAAPWIKMPGDMTASATLGGRIRAAGRDGRLRGEFDVDVRDIELTNEAGTLVATQVDAQLAGAMRPSPRAGAQIEARVLTSKGQALAGPVVLDFSANPLQVVLEGTMRDGSIELDASTLALTGLLDARATAEVALEPKAAIRRARIEVKELRFPAAYTSFLELTLATTGFGTLETAGSLQGSIEVVANKPVALDASVSNLQLRDKRGRFSLHDVHGAFHWVADGSRDVQPSRLEWSRGGAYGLSGGESRLDFRVRGKGFELTRPARLPIFDGALNVRSFAVRGIGEAQTELDFDAVIEPISMPLLSKAFGWPPLAGKLSGSIPGVTYRNHLLAINGDLEAQVFDGTITGRNFRLQDPLGKWPRAFADIAARSLDLRLVTGAFPIGSITGRLDADIRRLELFNWSPVAFDARLISTPGDRSEHRISQKAVTTISSIGGGGNAVASALQSGFLQFFDDFRYDRIGITCQLRNGVCLMGGIDRGGSGYYLVRGGGIPRIDIVANQGRVDWPQLVRVIAEAMKRSPATTS